MHMEMEGTSFMIVFSPYTFAATIVAVEVIIMAVMGWWVLSSLNLKFYQALRNEKRQAASSDDSFIFYKNTFKNTF